MLNKKGFAVSIILYSISAIIVVVLLLIVAIYAANVHNNGNLTDEIKEEVSGIGIE